MKTAFLKYYLSFVVLLFTTLTCFAHQLEIKQVDYKDNNSETAFYQEVKVILPTIALKKVNDKGFHKETIHHTVVNHLKANFLETEFEAETVVKLKKVKALFKFNLLRFAQALQNNDAVEKAGQIPFKFSKFYSFLNNALYIKLHVLRL